MIVPLVFAILAGMEVTIQEIRDETAKLTPVMAEAVLRIHAIRDAVPCDPDAVPMAMVTWGLRPTMAFYLRGLLEAAGAEALDLLEVLRKVENATPEQIEEIWQAFG
ncbi:MAG: hypothetical protein ACYTG4_13730 [Planctomycetota bacterium]